MRRRDREVTEHSEIIDCVKKNGMWVNIDSQAPNKVVKEWLMKQGYDCIKPEYAFGNHRRK